ncbi:unnamed protein product [Prorocentrum cordatum]|uniref:Uncharacterized protein n=1 Tax=Prorocentrum cordatum TaxID=2364126 RepID=A0ABN9WAU2_9DINO|nr:unnamed protein product [Polarella glacialis]
MGLLERYASRMASVWWWAPSRGTFEELTGAERRCPGDPAAQEGALVHWFWDLGRIGVVERQSLSAKVIDKCICPQGTFWHWRINKCQNQGGWGYECGFFPKDRWRCADGLTCKPVPNSSDVYYSYGRHHGTAGSRPATCQTCGPEDDCKLAEDRHNGDCLRGVELSGNATATIRVTVSSSATATATASHTAEAEEVASATANHTVQAKTDGGGGASATAAAEHASRATETASVNHTTTAEALGSAEASAAISAEEIMARMGFGALDISPTMAASMISAADELVFGLALEKAKALAEKESLAGAKERPWPACGHEAPKTSMCKA